MSSEEFNSLPYIEQFKFLCSLDKKERKQYTFILDNDGTLIKYNDEYLRLDEYLGNSCGVRLLLQAMGFEAEFC